MVSFTSKIYAKEILNKIKNKTIIVSQRKKNIDFIKKYSLSKDDIDYIINNYLNENNFKRRIENEDLTIKADYLYEFTPLIELSDINGIFINNVFIKMCETKEKEDIFIVSLHECEF